MNSFLPVTRLLIPTYWWLDVSLVCNSIPKSSVPAGSGSSNGKEMWCESFPSSSLAGHLFLSVWSAAFFCPATWEAMSVSQCSVCPATSSLLKLCWADNSDVSQIWADNRAQAAVFWGVLFLQHFHLLVLATFLLRQRMLHVKHSGL